jgi:hypothetical protein
VPENWTSLALPGLAFAGFVVLALFVRPGATARSPAVAVLILYAVGVSSYAGFSLNDLWPFASWHYVAYRVGEEGVLYRLVAVDSKGAESELDTRAFEPLEFASTIGAVSLAEGTGQSEHAREQLAFLLKLSQHTLEEAKAGRTIGTFSRFLGSFSAPVFQVRYQPWSDPAKRPDRIVSLRGFWLHWRIKDDNLTIESRTPAETTER